MQREEDIRYPSATSAHQTSYQGHNHPALDEEDDYDDEEDDEEYDSQDEEDYEGDEMVSQGTAVKLNCANAGQDSMTEEQRMEEGRRMFQIFAARMFEQRVLTAYREKVAAERQQKLIEELEEESRLDTQREAKKAREAAKKKEKKKLQKQAKDEEKAKKDAEKAAQEAAQRESEERKLEEQRQRKEEQRKKREVEKKVAEEERVRKEAEKQRRQQQERERQIETERKARESKEREKRQREEARKKEREEREAKEKEARERRLKEEKERKAKDDQARKEKEFAVKADKEAKDRAAPTTRPQPVALPPGLHPHARNPHLQSPAFQVATPIVPPKVPTPGRNRQPSQPGPQSHGSSPHSQRASTEVSHSASPASVAMPQTPAPSHLGKIHGQPPLLHHPQPSAPRSPLNNVGRGQYPFNMNGLPGLGFNGPPASAPGMMPNMMPPMGGYQGLPGPPNQHRFAPNGMQYPPGFGAPRPFHQIPPMQFHPQQPPMSTTGPAPPSQPPQSQAPIPMPHSRQPSGSKVESAPAPIARPGPIARPSSTTPDKRQSHEESDVDHITAQLGSKALLDDSDEPILSHVESRNSLPSLGPPGSTRMSFASSFPETKHDSFGFGGSNWGGLNPNVPVTNSWGGPNPPRQSPGWGQTPFGSLGSAPQSMQRSHAPRPVAVRLLLKEACRRLAAPPGISRDNGFPVHAVLRQLEQLQALGEPSVSMDEMLGICDTEGNAQNGGGTFEVHIDAQRGQVIKYEEVSAAPPRGSAGDIGSPLPSHSTPFGSVGMGFGSSFGRGH